MLSHGRTASLSAVDCPLVVDEFRVQAMIDVHIAAHDIMRTH